jgi:hypothetical protein
MIDWQLMAEQSFCRLGADFGTPHVQRAVVRAGDDPLILVTFQFVVFFECHLLHGIFVRVLFHFMVKAPGPERKNRVYRNTVHPMGV